jgi:hypothetical protein
VRVLYQKRQLLSIDGSVQNGQYLLKINRKNLPPIVQKVERKNRGRLKIDQTSPVLRTCAVGKTQPAAVNCLGMPILPSRFSAV